MSERDEQAHSLGHRLNEHLVLPHARQKRRLGRGRGHMGIESHVFKHEEDVANRFCEGVWALGQASECSSMESRLAAREPRGIV